MSRKAGIIAPSPPPPCTLFELVRMVREMENNEKSLNEINSDIVKSLERFIARSHTLPMDIATPKGDFDNNIFEARNLYLTNVNNFLWGFFSRNQIDDKLEDFYLLSKQYNNLIQKALDETQAKYTPPDNFDNTDINVYIYALIFKCLADFAFRNEHYFIALDLMHKSIQYETSYRTYNGLTIPTIKNRTKKEVNSKRGKKSTITRYGDRVEQQKKYYLGVYDRKMEKAQLEKLKAPTRKAVAKWIYNNEFSKFSVDEDTILRHLSKALKERKNSV